MENLKHIPNKLRSKFAIKNVKFKTSKIEEHLLNDLYSISELTLQKLNRDVTKDVIDEIRLYINQKRNLRFVMIGETRSGKSLIMIKFQSVVFKHYGVHFNNDLTKYICGNQLEYRQKLKNAKFGDFYLVDENFFNRSGIGSNIEHAQLQDYNSQIAKKNISVGFIHPERMLRVGATMGFSTYGRDSNNWLSRLLVYKIKEGIPHLVGYMVVDVGEMFHSNGCLVFKEVGGCTNNNKLLLNDISKDLIKHSHCIHKEYDKDKIHNDKIVCPFYDVCKHGLCGYEHIKDSWIEAEMSGTIDFRTMERIETALKIMYNLILDMKDDNNINLDMKNGKDLKNKVKLRLHLYTNAKLGIAEFDELLEIIKSNASINFLAESLNHVRDKNLIKKYLNHETLKNVLVSAYDKRKQIIKDNEEKEN